MKQLDSHLIDSHAHLTCDALYQNVDELLQTAYQKGVKNIINICTDLITLERGLSLSKKYPWVYQTAATTPHDVEKEGELVFDQIAQIARKGQLIAIGETGLDYHYQYSKRQTQQHFLRRYLNLALECKLPVVIHCREAFADLFNIIDKDYCLGGGRLAPGILHCFTGNMQEAMQVIERGWMLSLSGIVTFKKSIELQEIAKEIPLKQLLIETDAPYLAPRSHRGKINEPAYLVETASFIADIKQITYEELAQATTTNAKQIFCLL